jgi:hypothetical protein
VPTKLFYFGKHKLYERAPPSIYFGLLQRDLYCKTNTMLSRTRRQNSRAAGLVKSVSLLRMLANESSRYEIAITLLSPSSADFGDNHMLIWLVLASLASIIYCRSASAVSSSQACFLSHCCIARLLEVLTSDLEHPYLTLSPELYRGLTTFNLSSLSSLL